MEAVLLFDEEDLEAQTGIKRECDPDIEEENSSHKKDSDSQDDTSQRGKEEDESNQALQMSNMEKLDQDLLSVDEDWREYYKEALTYTSQVEQELFEPIKPWNKWQETKNYRIEVSIIFSFHQPFFRLVCPTPASLWFILTRKLRQD